MEQLMTAMESATGNTGNLVATSTNGESINTQRADKAENMGTASQSSSSRSSGGSSSMGAESTSNMDSESTGHIQSPEHKRQRSRRTKKPLHDSIRRHLDNKHFSNSSPLDPDLEHTDYLADPTAAPGSPLSLSTPLNGSDSIEEDDLLTPRSPTPPPSPEHPDPESQYTEKSFPPADLEESSNQEGNPSHRRGLES